MKAIIMAGGFGTRLRPLTMTLPKPMVPMMNRPMMEHIVRLLVKHGFTDITSLLYFHPDAITSHFLEGDGFGIKMSYIKAEADFGTAGSVRNATEQMGIKERIIIISGDVLTDFDLTEAIRFHEKKKAKATIVLTHVKNPLQFGVVMTDEQGNITRFLEKPSWGEVFSDTINTGIYILEPEAFEQIPYKREFDFSKDLFPALLAQPGALAGYIADGYWRDIGNLQEYHEAHMDVLGGHVNIELEDLNGDGNPALRGKNLIASGARIAEDAHISNSIIGPGCEIEPGAIVENSVLWGGTKVGAGASLRNVVTCFDVQVGRNASVNENVFIGERSVIGDSAEVMPNVKLWPDKRVEPGAKLLTSLVYEDKWSRALFTNSRISGASNIEITPEFVAKVGTALGATVGMGQTVVISRDSDPGSRVVSRALTSGLMSAGINVSDLQVTPIPLTRHHLRSGRQSGGIHIRKNPIDKRRTDIIFFDGAGYDLPTGKGKSVERYFFGEDAPRAPFDQVGKIDFPAHTGESYVQRFNSALDMDSISRGHFKIAIDYAYGITSTIFPNILGSLGAEVVSINGYLEPSRLTRAREEFERSTKHLANVVTSLKYELGFVLDAGGERIGVIDENGNLYVNNRLLTVVTRLFIESQRARGKEVRKIAVPISATAEVEELAAHYGVEVVFTKNTHASMMEYASMDDIDFVGGTLGGFIFPDYFFAVDGMFTAAKIMEMLTILGKSLGQVADGLPHRIQTKRQVFCPTDQLGTVMRHAMDHSRTMKTILVDGIKMYPDGDSGAWVLVLPEKERPYCEVLVDAPTRDAAEALADSYAKQVYEWRGNLDN
ncbi:MAG TPA: sugar phosphate nucleotidyltransferase [Candidatus Kapabacteria bacterium]|nr:sugar phosphate nucleotidyltransferase [Candidatus Kapabacteria bacterium]